MQDALSYSSLRCLDALNRKISSKFALHASGVTVKAPMPATRRSHSAPCTLVQESSAPPMQPGMRFLQRQDTAPERQDALCSAAACVSACALRQKQTRSPEHLLRGRQTGRRGRRRVRPDALRL
eukprot:6177164-Pleurochrysis_carterae.AAC.1